MNRRATEHDSAMTLGVDIEAILVVQNDILQDLPTPSGRRACESQLQPQELSWRAWSGRIGSPFCAEVADVCQLLVFNSFASPRRYLWGAAVSLRV